MGVGRFLNRRDEGSRLWQLEGVGGLLNPKGPCSQVVCTSALKYSPERYFWGPKSVLFGYMDP